VHFASLSDDVCIEVLPQALSGPEPLKGNPFGGDPPAVYMLKKDEVVALYAWLLPDELEEIEQLESKSDGVQEWLDSLDVQFDSV